MRLASDGARCRRQSRRQHQTEMKERKDLIDDALHAQAAAEEGIVPGRSRIFRAIEASKTPSDKPER